MTLPAGRWTPWPIFLEARSYRYSPQEKDLTAYLSATLSLLGETVVSGKIATNHLMIRQMIQSLYRAMDLHAQSLASEVISIVQVMKLSPADESFRATILAGFPDAEGRKKIFQYRRLLWSLLDLRTDPSFLEEILDPVQRMPLLCAAIVSAFPKLRFQKGLALPELSESTQIVGAFLSQAKCLPPSLPQLWETPAFSDSDISLSYNPSEFFLGKSDTSALKDWLAGNNKLWMDGVLQKPFFLKLAKLEALSSISKSCCEPNQ